MARWEDVVDSDPHFAAEVQQVFDAHRHKTIATLRRDGSPRLRPRARVHRRGCDVRHDASLAEGTGSSARPEDRGPLRVVHRRGRRHVLGR